jgi:hypothetical protein
MTARAPLVVPDPLLRTQLDLVLLEVSTYLREAAATYGSRLTAAEVQLAARDLRHLLVLFDHRALAERSSSWRWEDPQ